MANTFSALAVPNDNGAGAATVVTGLAPNKTISVEGERSVGVVVIEGSHNGSNYAPLFTFNFENDPAPPVINYVLSHIRVRRDQILVGTPKPVVNMGGEQLSGNSYGSFAVPVMEGVGAELDTSTFGDIKTLIISGPYAGLIVIEGSLDGVNFAPVFTADTNNSQATTLNGVWSRMRVRRGGTGAAPVVTIGASTFIGGSSGVQGVLVFADVATMSAFNTAGLPESTPAWVATLKREFQLLPLSVATLDTINFDYVQATPTGRWADTGDANQQWLDRDDWYIDSVAGDNEGAGSLAAPLQTARELYKRTHGLSRYSGTAFNATLLTNLIATDTIVIDINPESKDQTESFNLIGTKTVAASGTATVVIPLDPSVASGGQFLTVTLSANIDAHVGKYIRFFDGAVFRASAWVTASLGANVYVLTTGTDENGQTFPFVNNIVSPVAGDSFQVYNFTTAPDLRVLSSIWPLNAHAYNVEFTNDSFGSGFTKLDGVKTPLKIVGCNVNAQTYNTRHAALDMVNSRTEAFSSTAGPQGGEIFLEAGLHEPGAFGNDYFFASDTYGERPTVFFNRYPLFNGTRIEIGDCNVNLASSQHSAPAFRNVTTGPLVTLRCANTASFDRIWGTGNSAVIGFSFVGINSKIRFREYIPNLDTTLQLELGAAEAALVTSQPIYALYSDLSVTGIRDDFDNVVFLTQSVDSTPLISMLVAGQPVRRINGISTLPVANIVRSGGLTVIAARADTAANAANVLGITENTASAGALVYILNGDYVWVNFDAAPTVPAIAYLSTATAGRATTTIPAVAGTNQKLRLGHVMSAVGTLGLVAWKPEVLAVLADGAA